MVGINCRNWWFLVRNLFCQNSRIPSESSPQAVPLLRPGLALTGSHPPPPLPPSPPPSHGHLKLNRAVALRKNSRSIGTCATIRDDNGRVLAARFNQLPGSFNLEVGELIALRKGLLLALFCNLHIDIAEVASPNVLSILNDPAPPVGGSKFLVQDIKAMFLDVGICKSQVISKAGNSLAHKLALEAFSSVKECHWLDSSPLPRFSSV
ncbi:hypothetical protein Dsin_024383 [Dipteronia sinensis]|uniref:RNase H type-1 domain-containing protein n=1 Tax=Dipteronia sinensis TaxID=43782 RepID=A0AAD9ZV92_9ROSI|nr:hypothetical protein Dsin_024383 [Dipteronia sinensis]